MAQAALTPAARPAAAPATPDWVAEYYTPAAANTTKAPNRELTALDLMYAYYDA